MIIIITIIIIIIIIIIRYCNFYWLATCGFIFFVIFFHLSSGSRSRFITASSTLSLE